MCACRGGYRLNGTPANDGQKQIRVKGQPFVYVYPGGVCDTLCDEATGRNCQEVVERDSCVR